MNNEGRLDFCDIELLVVVQKIMRVWIIFMVSFRSKSLQCSGAYLIDMLASLSFICPVHHHYPLHHRHHHYQNLGRPNRHHHQTNLHRPLPFLLDPRR